MALLKTVKKWLSPLANPTTLSLYHWSRAVWANIRYGFPARGMLVIGVTGTKGKTTTTHFVASILEEAGFKVGMASTTTFKIGKEETANDTNMSVTAPLPLQRLIRQMRDARCDALVIEVTSIALEQFRTWGIPFRFVGFTNLSHDHLDYHGTMEKYALAKLKLFQGRSVRAAVANAADPVSEMMLAKTTAKRRWAYQIGEPDHLTIATDHIWADKISTNPEGASFTLVSEHEEARVRLQMPGKFNIENALCAAALALNLNLKVGTVVAGLQKLERVPGRLEKIPSRKGFSVMVDYAHTPDSLEKLYSTLRPDVRGRMIAVLGATGDRDRTKRPIMGALAARFNDFVFITDEEPYTEDPLEIIEEVSKGVPRGRALFRAPSSSIRREERPLLKKQSESGEGDWWWKVPDRKEAIEAAINMAKMDDLILVTGMGAQNFRKVGDEKQPWNDRAIIEDILKEKNLL